MLGLAVVVTAFRIGVCWVVPALANRVNRVEKQRIWTSSLVSALILIALHNLLTTYVALGPSIESML